MARGATVRRVGGIHVWHGGMVCMPRPRTSRHVSRVPTHFQGDCEILSGKFKLAGSGLCSELCCLLYVALLPPSLRSALHIATQLITLAALVLLRRKAP